MSMTRTATLALLFSLPISISSEANFNGLHYCSQHPASNICQVQTSIRTINKQTTDDFFIVPHRGLWGLTQDPHTPENSIPAITAADSAGYKVVEVDLLRVKDGLVASHDFVFPRLTSSYSGEWLWEQTVDEISTLFLRDRFGSISSTHVATASEIFEQASSREMVVMVDTRPKKAHMLDGKCVALCDYLDGSVKYDVAYMNNILATIRSQTGLAKLAGMVFKVPYPLDYVREKVGEQVFGKVLWMVQINPTKLQWYLVNHGIKPPGYVVTLEDLLDFVDNWDAARDSISAWETAYKDGSDIRLRSFSKGGRFYENLLTYLIEETMRRPGMFSGEPVGTRGLVNEFGDWRIGPDPRADHVSIVNYPGANHMVITTDRADVWEGMNDD